MKRSLILLKLTALAPAIAATVACGVERTSTVLGPSKVATAVTAATTTVAGKTSSSPSLLGTWVMQNNMTTSAVSGKAITTLPDFSSCTNFQWTITTQTEAEVAGGFGADCSGGMSIVGTISGKMTQIPIPIVLAGALTRGADSCSFSLAGTGLPITEHEFLINYSGQTCLGPISGQNTLRLASPKSESGPTSVTLTGTVTDATSGGILPNVEVRTAEFLAVRTDAAGHYELPGVPTGAVSVQIAAAGYVTQTQPVTLTENFVLDVVLHRVAPPAPAPGPAAPSGGDQIDLHSAIIRGGCCGDVANWPVTTQIRVLDFAFGGAFVDFSKKEGGGRWPDVTPPGWDGGIQYTLWLVVNHNGQWITAGGVEYWHGLARQGGPPSRYASNWYYSPQVWGELANHQPQVGEMVGFFVTAGDQRAKDVRAVTERSNVVLVPFPSDGGAYYWF